MDITNKMVKVARRIEEIESELSQDGVIIESYEESLRRELKELLEWDEFIGAYFNLRDRLEEAEDFINELIEGR